MKEKTISKEHKELIYYCVTTFFERFSFYGLIGLLIFYLSFSINESGLGLSEIEAIEIVTLFSALSYLTGLLGGYVSDNILGGYRGVLFGIISEFLGFLILTLTNNIYTMEISLFLIALGIGFIKPSLSNMVGKVHDEHYQADRSFSTYFLYVNLGAFFGPIVAGTLGFSYNFHIGFGLIAFEMFVALIYFLTKNTIKNKYQMPHFSFKKNKTFFYIIIVTIIFIITFILLTMLNNSISKNIFFIISGFFLLIPLIYFYYILTSEITKEEKNKVISYIPIFLVSIFFFIITEQLNSTMLLYIKDHIIENWIEPTWIISINSFFVIIFSPLFIKLWDRLKNRRPNDHDKFIICGIILGLSFFSFGVPLIFSLDGKVSAIYFIIGMIFMVLGELLLWPIGLSITSKLSPNTKGSEFMALWGISPAISQAINMNINTIYVSNPISFFLLFGLLSILSAICLLFLPKKVIKIISNK
ncbi:MAG: oligopeptide:H+ symporter [Methanobrevibacter sp.]|jgi:POT family proton-dependent oligopeptide transporter|nr:oligopeptide:H+ symporter [Candidatus Methanovirga australis]